MGPINYHTIVIDFYKGFNQFVATLFTFFALLFVIELSLL